jgi:hypothetical protein
MRMARQGREDGAAVRAAPACRHDRPSTRVPLTSQKHSRSWTCGGLRLSFWGWEPPSSSAARGLDEQASRMHTQAQSLRTMQPSAHSADGARMAADRLEESTKATKSKRRDDMPAEGPALLDAAGLSCWCNPVTG